MSESRDRQQLLRQRQQQARCHQPTGNPLYDPIEDDAQYAESIALADFLAEQELANTPVTRGFCHRYWQTKQRILKDRFSLVWFTPSEMNPSIRFD